ncbi:Flavone synthase I [Operophtera brumata]|uniref:Flavone synthase I n=1 Tax=Operophtera brumata TaxID=104452 RepID=A0A0L7L9E4_OPEBR|nr:Flavone synthase I [Operophtera brumata]
MKSVVRRIGQQLFNALSGKGIAVLVNHGIADEKSDGRNASTMRLLYYPPVPPEDEGPCCPSDAVHYTRCGAHADYGTFTLLTQDSEGGLELGDSYQALSNTHNVPTGAYARARGRHCVAYFCHPDNDAILPPLPLRVAPAPAPLPFAPVHITLHHRLLNAAHHLQKRFKETYA